MTNNDGDLIPFNPRMLPLLLFGPAYGEKAGGSSAEFAAKRTILAVSVFTPVEGSLNIAAI